jgi:hypothetical protein
MESARRESRFGSKAPGTARRARLRKQASGHATHRGLANGGVTCQLLADPMRTSLCALLFWFVPALLHADELERFWAGFPGFKNTLASYGYDRSFSMEAKPEFVDGVVRESATKPSKRRLGEYLCVLFYMDRETVAARLAALEASPSPAIRNAVVMVRKRLEDYGKPTPKPKQ